nr:MAG TPA: hypothetical protein [Caudoviricetes sp.]
MKKIMCDLILNGGRGSDSGYAKKGINTGGNNKPMPFYDKTDKYRGMHYLDFEEKIRGKNVEYVGLYDENGKIVVAGTSYNSGAVGIPTSHPNFNKATRLTHNHPTDSTRVLGGSFSGADVYNHVTLNLNSTRAVAKEKTYTIQKSKTFKRNDAKRMLKKASTSDTMWDKGARKLLSKVNKDSLTHENIQTIKLGYGTRVWKNLTKNSGYDYIEKKIK